MTCHNCQNVAKKFGKDRKGVQRFRCDHLATRYSVAYSALSARDQEIKEVLEGLSDDGCFDACFLRWMKRYEDSDGFEHTAACLAARALWEKVNQCL